MSPAPSDAADPPMSVTHPAPLAIAPPNFIGLPATLTAELPSSGLGVPQLVQ